MNSCDFVRGVVQIDQVPRDRLPFVFLAGRSNCGKSSLLNMLVARRKAARVSKTPGRTREANFFLIDKRYFLIDLPGYAYARGVKREVVEEWGRLVPALFLDPRARLALVLVDIRRGVQEEERQVLGLAESSGAAARMVFTKADKLGRGAVADAVREAGKAARLGDAPIISSAKKGEGRNFILKAIDEAIEEAIDAR